jgi:hypothetical protein
MVAQGEQLVAGQPAGKGSVGSWLGLGGLEGLGLLPSLSSVVKYSCLLCWNSREKSGVEQEIKEKEETIQQRTSEVQVGPDVAFCVTASSPLTFFFKLFVAFE